MSQYRAIPIQVRGHKDSKMPSRVNIKGKIVSFPHPSTIAAFIDSLSNPEIPTRCSVFYAGINVVFISYPECAEELRRTNPEIFATAIRFLAHFRSDENVATIAQPVCKCPRDIHWWVHDVAQCTWPSTTLEAGGQLFDSICSIVHGGLMNTREVGISFPSPTIEKLVKQSDKSLKATGRATWPTKYTDVFGNNPQLLAHMLWTIFNQFPDAYEPLFLLHSLVKLSQSTMVPALARIPGWARQLVDHANSTLDANLQIRRVLGKFDLLTEFLDETRIALGRGGDMAIFHAWHRLEGREREDAVLLASRALCMDTFKDSHDQQTQKLVFIGDFFYEMCDSTSVFGFSLGEEWPPLSPRINTESYNPFKKYLQNPDLIKTDACEKIYKIATFTGCGAPNCFASTATLDRKLQACSACHVVRYCSQECQQSAWKHPDISHKPMCRLLSKITGKLGVEWRKLEHPNQQDILTRNVEKLTEKEAQEIMELELRMSTWKTLARSKPWKQMTSEDFKKIMEATHAVQELQRINAAKK